MNPTVWVPVGWGLLSFGVLLMILAIWVKLGAFLHRRPKELFARRASAAEEEQVAPLVNGDRSPFRNRSTARVRELLVYKLAQQLTIDVGKLSESIEEEATREAEEEAVRIRDHALVAVREQILERFRSEASVKPRAIIDEAEEEAQRVLRVASEEAQATVGAAKRKADQIESAAGIMLRKLTHETDSAVSNISGMLPVPDGRT